MSQMTQKMSYPQGQVGLTEEEVVERRKAGQGNTLALKVSRSYFRIIYENFFVLINIILFVLALALVLLGQISDALVSVGVVFFNVAVGTLQEIRAKRVLDRISLLTRPTATVVRSGHACAVDPNEIVVGDLLLLKSGDQVVVDGTVMSEAPVEVDESLLSGEADLVPKAKGDKLYSGSFCMSGSAEYIAESVGENSLAGHLTTGARTFRRIFTPLQRQINVILQITLLVALFFEMLLVLAVYDSNISLVGYLKMAVVIIGIVPKGLLLAISVAYALGALRILDKGVLIQQANAIESLSHVDVLCMDKTGTLTTNTLVAEEIYPVQMELADLRQLLGDYVASVTAGNRTSEAIQESYPGQRRRVCEEVAFSSARKWSALIFDDPQRQGLYVLGAPEVVLPSLSQDGGELEQIIAGETARGRRVLLVAGCVRPVPLVSLYNSAGSPVLPSDLMPLGVVTLRDQLRPEAQATLDSFQRAGIELKVISGDHQETVAALARQAGFGLDVKSISGEALASLEPDYLAQVAEEKSVFGRITPQQKAQLVQALRKRGHKVAMIGDGVNDIFALKEANLGIAMQSGSSATRGVADIVLLKDSFAALPQIFTEGQRIRHGLYNILKLFLTRVSYMVILLVAIMVVNGFPFVPKQNAILTLLTEGIPALALAAWAKPEANSSSRELRSVFHFVVPAAITLSLVAIGVYTVVFFKAGQMLVAQSALTTFTIVSGLLLVLFVVPPSQMWVGGSKLEGDRRILYLIIGLLIGYAALLAIPPLRAFFDLTALQPTSYLLLVLMALLWALIVRTCWRARVFERLVGMDEKMD